MTLGGAKRWLSAVVVGLALLVAVPASAQTPTTAISPPGGGPEVTTEGACAESCHRPDARIRRRNSTVWVGDGIHNLDAAGQSRVATVRRRGTARFVVRFDNDGIDTDTFVVQGTKNTSRFFIRYFVNGSQVSQAVRNGVFRFADVPPGGGRVMAVEVQARNTAVVGNSINARVLVRSADEAGLLDRVKAVVYRSNSLEARILGRPFTTRATAERWARRAGASPRFVYNARLFWELAPPRGVRPEVAYAQSAKETAYGNFGGVLDASWRNSCGLKTTAGGSNSDPNAHQRFVTWRQGVIACIDHLALYAGAPGYPRPNSPDPRHFPSIRGTAPTVEQLGGRWAPAPDYGISIVREYLNPLLGS